MSHSSFHSTPISTFQTPYSQNVLVLITMWKIAENLGCWEVQGTLKFIQFYTSFHSLLLALENKSLMEFSVFGKLWKIQFCLINELPQSSHTHRENEDFVATLSWLTSLLSPTSLRIRLIPQKLMYGLQWKWLQVVWGSSKNSSLKECKLWVKNKW